MRNFSGIIAWYSADMLAWIPNISIIFIVNSKIALVFETELLNWNANEESLQKVGRQVFRLEPLYGFRSDFAYAKFPRPMQEPIDQCCNSTF